MTAPTPKPQPSNLHVAAVAVTAMHGPARDIIRTRAHLRAWLIARQRGIARTPAAGGYLGLADCDAIADAALDAMYELLAQWAADADDRDQR